MRILLVEDEKRLAASLTRGLREEGHAVDVCDSAMDAQQRVKELEYDLLLLDWMLPDSDGVALLRALRRDGDATSVIMLTARGTVEERVLGLRSGADDYLVKPFAFEELLARIEAVHRRATGRGTLMTVGGATLDPKRHELRVENLSVSLSAREMQLLLAFFERAGDILSRSFLLGEVWGGNFDGDPNVLDVYLGYLRKKLLTVEARARIEAVRGVGFRLRVEPEVS